MNNAGTSTYLPVPGSPETGRGVINQHDRNHDWERPRFRTRAAQTRERWGFVALMRAIVMMLCAVGMSMALAFERVDALILSGEGDLTSAVIDPSGEFAYFGTFTSPGRVVKVDLATFEVVDVLTLASGENELRSAVIDPSGEFAYFGTLTSPGRVVKIDLSSFERAGSITLESFEELLVSAVIDPAGQFAYFGTSTFPGGVVKIDLSSFERVGSIMLDAGEDLAATAVMDPAGDFAYFGTATFPGRVVRIDLDSFERVGAVVLYSGEEMLFTSVIDSAGEFAYFGTSTNPGRVVKIDLSSLTRVDSMTLESGENGLSSSVIDPSGEFAYFGTSTGPGQIIKTSLPDFQRVDAVTLESGENGPSSAVIAPDGGFAYFGTLAFPPRVVQISLEDGLIFRDSFEVSESPPSGSSTRLNDTGIDWCAAANTNHLDCPVETHPGQDGDTGRDALARQGLLEKVGSGAAGFDFTKLDAVGNTLPAGALEWSCVLDNHTGLIWEVKTADPEHPRYRGHTYSWFNPDASSNGGDPGREDGGFCTGSICDTQGFVNQVNNQGLCGASDWRMPTRIELRTIVHRGRTGPTIDTDFFPNTQPINYMSHSAFVDAAWAWSVSFGNGWSNRQFKTNNAQTVRLVRN